jgi:F-type H+-transporting ATPase subunit delta
MNESVIASRYANGLASHAREQNALEDVRADLNTLADLLDPERGEIAAAELPDLLASPAIPDADKIRITDTLCAKLEIGKIVSQFLNVLIRKKRINIVGEIARQYDRIASDLQGVANAVAESAAPLTPAQEEDLNAALARATGRRVQLSVRVDPELVAGLRVRLADRVIDGTLAGRLDRLGERLQRA